MVLLPRTGWTATASDSYQWDPPSKVLDGDASSHWHSKWEDTPAPLPHHITIDMKSAKIISGLAYMPRQDASNNGNIGQYTIATSPDGTNFTTVAQGTWADTKATKTVTFTNGSARYVRLTGITEAGGRGPWSAAAEINVIGELQQPPTNTGILFRGG
jgi:galactose oxidase